MEIEQLCQPPRDAQLGQDELGDHLIVECGILLDDCAGGVLAAANGESDAFSSDRIGESGGVAGEENIIAHEWRIARRKRDDIAVTLDRYRLDAEAADV